MALETFSCWEKCSHGADLNRHLSVLGGGFAQFEPVLALFPVELPWQKVSAAEATIRNGPLVGRLARVWLLGPAYPDLPER